MYDYQSTEMAKTGCFGCLLIPLFIVFMFLAVIVLYQ